MIDKTITFDRFVRWMLGGLLAVAILYVVNYLSSALLPFFVAWFLAYLIYPIVCFVQYRLHVPGRFLSILVTLVFLVAVIAGMVYMIVPPMVEQFEKLGTLLTNYLQDTTHVYDLPRAIRRWVSENTDQIGQFFRKKEVTAAIQQAMPKLFTMLSETANVIVSVVASLITLLYMFFILLDYETLVSGVVKIAPKKSRPFWKSLLADVSKEMNNYIRGQGLVALCIGILFSIGFTLIDFPMAIGMGLMIGVMSLIPYVHSLALIPIVFLSLLKAADTGQSFLVILLSALAVFLVIQLITDLVLTPRIMGKAMRLNPAILLLSLSVWGTLLGFIGLIVALPLTTLIIAYYRRYVIKEEEIKSCEEKSDE